MFENLIAVQYCYNYLIDQIPVGLLIYSHVPTALLALLFGAYVMLRTRNTTGFMLFVVCTSFATWCALDLTSWFAFLGSELLMFTWSIQDLVALMMFICAYGFLFGYITSKNPPTWQILVGNLLILPTAVWTAFGQNLTHYDANACVAIENDMITRYPYIAEGIFILSVIAMTMYFLRRPPEGRSKREIAVAGTGVALFLTFFFSSTLLVNILSESDASSYVYNYEIYGLFGMPIFLAYFGYLIVRYKAFNIKVFGAQALVVTVAAIIASEFAFVTSLSNRILVAVTLGLVGIAGYVLIQSVRKEIEQREIIQKQEKELEIANAQQETLLHFISHEIKGYLTKSEAAFASIIEGDFGAITTELDTMARTALSDVRTGVATVMDILDASNLKKGTIQYAKVTFSMRDTVQKVTDDMRPTIEKKGVTLITDLPDGEYDVCGDEDKMRRHVIRNLLDNAFRYTPSGTITASLARTGNTIRFTVQDTGVGITDTDKTRLFTEGGHGKDSIKVNVHSTGYGLFIAKEVVEAHGGKIWAESDGPGKGSRFIAELPAA